MIFEMQDTQLPDLSDNSKVTEGRLSVIRLARWNTAGGIATFDIYH